MTVPGDETGTRAAPGRVLHYVQRWLPLSEQFVYAVVAGTVRPGVVVSRRRPENEGAFPIRPRLSLGWIPSPVLPRVVTESRVLTAALLAVVRRYDVEVVHQHFVHQIGDLTGMLRRVDLPYVLSVHGPDVTGYFRREAGFVRPRVSRAAAVVAPSRFFAEVVEGLGVDGTRIEVIPAGVDTQWFVPTPLPDGPPEAVFVGRFVEKKGIDVLCAAWPKVTAAVPEARLRLVGFGDLSALVPRLPDGVVVERADPQRRAEQVRAALQRARVVVTPSRTATDGDVETLLLVNLEAQASGRPVVTTRHGGIPEYVVDGETALLVPEGEPDPLADALVSVLSDSGLAQRMGAAGPAVAGRFDVRTCTKRIDDVYDRVSA